MAARPVLSLRPVVDDCCAETAAEADERAAVEGGESDTTEAGAVEAVARRLKALGDPARIRLLSLIAAAPSGEACVCNLPGPVGLSQPTVSHHMRLLVEAGLVAREQRGKWAYYRLVPAALTELGGAISGFARPASRA
jgi:ArsR family transcriptional regulator